jgi:ATP-dependent protease ClpP protease subunit
VKRKIARPRAQLRQGRTDWFRITNQAEGLAEVYIYDEIGYFGTTASDFVGQLNALKVEAIDLHLNSPGGEVFDGIAIYESLKRHPARVTVHVDSLAASIASVIAMSGDEIVMARSASMMIHDGHALCVGNAADMRETADLLDRVSDTIAGVYAERTGKEAARYRELMRAETWYSAEEAVAEGLADRVGGAAKESRNTWDLSIFNYSGREEAPAPVILEEPSFDWDLDAIRRAFEEAKR